MTKPSYLAPAIKKEITALRQEALKLWAKANEMESGENQRQAFEATLAVICETYRMGEDGLLSRRKSQRVAFARQVLCYAARKLTRLSFPELALLLHREYSTVMASCTRIDLRMATEPAFARTIESLLQTIRERIAAGQIDPTPQIKNGLDVVNYGTTEGETID